MKWMGLNELREKYLAFFESKEHLRLPSFSLVPQGDKRSWAISDAPWIQKMRDIFLLSR